MVARFVTFPEKCRAVEGEVHLSPFDPKSIRIVCPCFPDVFSDVYTHDYCVGVALFDGCPNACRIEALAGSLAEDTDPLYWRPYEKPDRTLEGRS